MALGYPYTSITGDSEEGQVEVQIAVLDEYHLADEQAILRAVRESLAAQPSVTGIEARRIEITTTKLPED
ncbi:hypothetical protein [Streptomyces acidicola]|uniref:Uncharacterized protein n=1 Tax=Streptomyces acidicola TaxID=2596892 RepID=A0A5N8WJ77_9ACTN|nr:hypothetical protein [Streptomyces acidicola]MPY47170.1 hypothetical protein [Streptomyces acidicola]MPY47309.1 hypothetical protein [Streptomyces acidicola]